MKRGVWLGVGFGLGVAAARRARRSESGVRAGHGRVARWARNHVQGALAEGRTEARRCEAALRAVLATPQSGARDPEK